MSTKTDYAFTFLHVISWIIFIGLCIEAGGFMFSTLITLWLTPEGATKFWTQVNLSELYHQNQSNFVVITALMIIVAIMKALMFYLIVNIFSKRKLDLSSPFNEIVGHHIFNIGYLAIGIGLFSFWGMKLTQWLVGQGIQMPDIQHLKFSGADVWVFMGVTLFVFGKIFQKGIDLQSENELTV